MPRSPLVTGWSATTTSRARWASGPAPRNVRDGLRMSTALTHLAAARGRPNLAIRAGAAVDRVELHGTTARGVRTADGKIIEADAIVVTAGAYASPAILMRSGIGPAAALRDLGIGVAADLPGVGGNLIDHPLVAVDLPTTPGFRRASVPGDAHAALGLADPDGPPDLHLFAAGPFDDAASPAGGVFGIVAGLLAVRSRGSVRLRSADPADPPRIDIAHLRHPEDMTRMIEATQHARLLSRTPPLAGFVTGAELAPGPRSATTTPPGWPARSGNVRALTTTRWEPARWAPNPTTAPSSTPAGRSTGSAGYGWRTHR